MITKLSSLCLLLFLVSTSAISQVATDPRTEEYATLRVYLSGTTGSFVTMNGVANPVLEMDGVSTELKDFTKDATGGIRFERVTDVLNYMNKFSFVLVDVTSQPLHGSKPNDLILIYTFKRKPKK